MSKKSESFGKYLRKFSDEPEKLRSRLKHGMAIEHARRALVARVHPSSYSTMIDYLAMKQVASAVGRSDKAFVSILVPSEILLAAGIMPVSAESLSGVLCAMNLEDIAIGKSDQMSLSQTLCTFHRASAGASRWGIFPSPKLVIAASTLCDGNDGTFKIIAQSLRTPFFLIDVPRGRKAEYVPYVEQQLEDMIALVEDTTGRAFSLGRLSEILEVEEETRR
ncbi:MAG: 2-hydroxyglutaryl-CoA dehydratase D-component, partial [Thermotogales bacterium 46_20]